MHFTWIFVAILAVYWCSENSSPIDLEDHSSIASFHQLPGCLESPLLKSASPSLRCFDYTFNGDLELEFCLPANCCPDSNRFDYNYAISNDTIYFTVLDTAKNLCDCICNYKIETKIIDLFKDAYIFQCLYYDSTIYDTLLYRRFD